MAPDDHAEDESPKLRFIDKRRFTEEGDPREGVETVEPEDEVVAEASAEASPPPAPPEPPPEAAPTPEPAPGGDEAPEMGMQDIGIEAVFLAFWQSVMMNLGAPDPSGRSMPPNLDAARESITLLQVLQEKTQGNLSPEENEMLQRLIHEAKVGYVEVSGTGGVP